MQVFLAVEISLRVARKEINKTVSLLAVWTNLERKNGFFFCFVFAEGVGERDGGSRD